MKWLWMLVKDPAEALDWYDPSGKLANAKVVSDLVVFGLSLSVIFVVLRTHKFPPTLLATALIAGAMGTRVFLSFIKGKNDASDKDVTDHEDRP